MKSRVYFVAVEKNESIQGINEKLSRLIAQSKVLDFIRGKEKVALKVHFGEEGNTGFVNPEHVRVICDAVKAKGGAAFLSDTNTLYRGKRLNCRDHLAVARGHGFRKEVTGAEVIIPDDSKKAEVASVPVNEKFVREAKLARIFIDADALITVTHFKGHILTGFGGSVKNIGMGCATREGKLAQHCDVAPVFYTEKCIGCGACVKACPAGAIRIENKKSLLDKTKCIGCASCLAACPTTAIFIDFTAGEMVQLKMAEYCLAVLKGKKDKAGFINFALKINQECDCWPTPNPRIAPDVGILASLDPVAVDKASFDLVNRACGRDTFKAAHPEQDGLRHLRHAQELGIGSLDYDLAEI